MDKKETKHTEIFLRAYVYKSLVNYFAFFILSQQSIDSDWHIREMKANHCNRSNYTCFMVKWLQRIFTVPNS